MKTGLCLALLVLLAFSNVLGQNQEILAQNNAGRTSQPVTDTSVQIDAAQNKPIAVIRQETKPIAVVQETGEPITVLTGQTNTNKFNVVPQTEITLNQDAAKTGLINSKSKVVITTNTGIASEQAEVKPAVTVQVDTPTIVSTKTEVVPGQTQLKQQVGVQPLPTTQRDITASASTATEDLPDQEEAATVVTEPEDVPDQDEETTVAAETEVLPEQVDQEQVDVQPADTDEFDTPASVVTEIRPKVQPSVTNTEVQQAEVEPATPEQSEETVTDDSVVDEPSEDTEEEETPVVFENNPAQVRKVVSTIKSQPQGGNLYKEELPNKEVVVVAGQLPSQTVVPTVNVQSSVTLENHVYVSGAIVVSEYRPFAVDSVQYNVKTGRLSGNTIRTIKPRLPTLQDTIGPRSRVMLYVSTVKTLDRNVAFANFSVGLTNGQFPLTFNIHVPLPREQLGLIGHADIRLFFFAYITDPESRIDTYLPDGTSEILLQETNRVVQQLQVNVKANGLEVKGLFRGRYSQRYINPGTAFQVVIVAEQSLSRLLGDTMESAAQLIINNVPEMYPVPFSLLIPYHRLKTDVKYYAIAYIFENGIERFIRQQPILIINEGRVLVTTEVTFTVVPNPFMLYGTITRAMPGPFYFAANSSIIISLQERDSNSAPFPFRLLNITQLPQDFQVNISQAPQFDATKNYDILAAVTDGQNQLYMTSLQKMPLLDQVSRLTIAVDDIFHYVQVRLHSSANQQLTYIAGSKARLIVTDNPETTSTPIYDAEFDPTDPNFREYLMKIQISRAQPYRNAYLILMISNSGIITHVSKILLISNHQPPPLRVELPVIPLNLVRGQIYDVDNRAAQWSASSYANLYLIDDQIEEPTKAIVQEWQIYLEREFPVRFEVHLDFSRLVSGHRYSLQSSINNGPNLLEYKPADSIRVLEPDRPIQDNIRVPVRNVKKTQFVQGLVYLNNIQGPLPERSQIIVRLSSTPLLSNPDVIYETRIDAARRQLPLNFTMELSLDQIDISSVYYFLVQYVVDGIVIVPATQAFAFAPRNDVTVVLRLSSTPQIRITGQVTSTGSRLVLPDDAILHLYITDSPYGNRPTIYSEVSLQASSNSQYQFTMYLDSLMLQRNVSLYLRSDILYQNNILLSLPRPALLQITPGGEWNINLVIDLPTLLVGHITLLGQQQQITGDFEVYIQILARGTENVVDTKRIRLSASFPQAFRVEIDNELFIQYPELEARAMIKNCKEEILFRPASSVTIQARLNVGVILPVVLSNPQRLQQMNVHIDSDAPLQSGYWRLSITGVVPGIETGVLAALDNGLVPLLQKVIV